MSELELIGKSVFFAVLAGAICGGFFHWGWQERAKLAVKLDYFGIRPSAWAKYDAQLRSGELQKRGELHPIRERGERGASDR